MVIRQEFSKQDIRLPTAEVFRSWTPYVARFSYEAGRITKTAVLDLS
jgi:hypothetical protein